MIDEIQLKFKDKIFILIAICGLILAFYFRVFNANDFKERELGQGSFSKIKAEREITDETSMSLEIGRSALQVEVAMSEEKKIAGLGNREFLMNDEGMLFIFPQKGKYAFEMRSMNFALDFIFINNDEVVEIIENVPSDFEGSIAGTKEYDKVLEVNAGWSRQNEVTVGSAIKWKIK